MIQVTCANNVKRSSPIVDENLTIKQVLEQEGIDYTRGIISLDGVPMKAGELNKTFADFGYNSEEGHNKATLLSVVKADNAA